MTERLLLRTVADCIPENADAYADPCARPHMDHWHDLVQHVAGMSRQADKAAVVIDCSTSDGNIYIAAWSVVIVRTFDHQGAVISEMTQRP